MKVIKKTASMTTQDGVRLDADIYRPDNQEKLPVLLMRQPYGKAIASTVVYAHPRWYAAQGYIVVIQDVRGRGTSSGKFELFSHEIEDGYETINWAANLEGSNGDVGMYGFSYQGMTQLYASAKKPSALKTICPAMIAYNLYSDWAYENGAFCLEINQSWAIQLAAETARLQEDYIAYTILYNASRNLPLSNSSLEVRESLQKYCPSNFYYQWLKHPEDDDYWQQFAIEPLIKDVDLPMLHIGGWFDPYLRGTLNLYKDLASRSKFPQYLIVGPWAHLPWGRKVGAIDYGSEAMSPIDKLQIAWFDYFLKGKNSGILEEKPVCLWEMGSNQWRYLDSFPENTPQPYYLQSNGLASVREDGGKLVRNLPSEAAEDVIVHDPWRPVPALGGHSSFPAGSFERSSLDCRNDIITYTSEPLTEDIYLAGEVSVKIYCSSEAKSFDLCVVLSEVYPDGSVYNFTQGYIRVNGETLATEKIELNLQATCIKIAQGNSLRSSLSAACFPAYPVNSGIKSAVVPGIDNQIISIIINCGDNYDSQVLLPFNNT